MKTVYLGITGDIIHPGIINIINNLDASVEVCCSHKVSQSGFIPFIRLKDWGIKPSARINESARLGNLIVGLLTDSAIATYKRLLYLTYEHRIKVIENMKSVSRVVLQEYWSYVPNLKEYKHDYTIHGDDWKTNCLSKIRNDVFETMKEWSGEVVEIPSMQVINSTALSDNTKSIGTTPARRKHSARKSARIKVIQKYARYTKIGNCGGKYVLFG